MQIDIRFPISVLALASALACGSASASGFQIRENSVKALGRANSGTAVASGDASVVANNPAAMTNLDSVTFQADVTVIDLTAEYSGGGTTAFGTPLQGGDGGDPGDATPVPALAIVVPLRGAFEGLTLGASVSAPFGLKTEYDAAWLGRYNAIESDVETIDVTLSAGLRLSERLSAGVGLIYQRADVTLSNGIDFGTALAAAGVPGFVPQSADGVVEVSGDDGGIGWVAGLQWRPTDALTLGYSHRSEIDHVLEGEADFDVPGSAAAVFAAIGNPSFNDGPVYAPLVTPSVDTLSLQYDFSDRFRMMADVQRTDWHSLDAVRIFRAGGMQLANEPFAWKDTWLYSVGGEFDLSETLTLRAGVAQDETPTIDETRSPRLPDNDRMLYSIGMTWNATDHWSIDAAYSRVEIEGSRVDIASTSGSRLIGDFEGYADLLGIAAQYRF